MFVTFYWATSHHIQGDSTVSCPRYVIIIWPLIFIHIWFYWTYKYPSIISGTGAATWSKTNFWPTGHYDPWSSLLPRVCTVPSSPVTVSFILEVVLCECVQHRLRFWLDHLICVKMSTFQFYVQSGKQGKIGCVGGVHSCCILVKKFPGEKGSVMRCFVVMLQPVRLSPKFGAKSSHIFTQSP
jgi:hypothetical protein